MVTFTDAWIVGYLVDISFPAGEYQIVTSGPLILPVSGWFPYSPVRIRRGVSNRRGGSGKISKTLQEGGHFLIRGGSDKPKMLQEGGP